MLKKNKNNSVNMLCATQQHSCCDMQDAYCRSVQQAITPH